MSEINTNKKIYILTKGCYSDKSNIAAFSSLEELEEFVKYAREKFKIKEGGYSDFNKPEIFELDEFTGFVQNGYSIYEICMDVNGNVTSCYENKYIEYVNHCYVSRPPKQEKQMCITVAAKDEKHAIKIASERRVQLIANNEF